MSIFMMLTMVFAIIVAFLLLVPSMSWLRRVLGYMFVADVASSAYCISTFAATSAVSGIAIAVFAALGISLTLRVIRSLIGSERLAVNGDQSIRVVAAEMLSQGTSWCRAVFMALFRGGRVDAPAPLNIEWVKAEAPVVIWYRRFVASARGFTADRLSVAA